MTGHDLGTVLVDLDRLDRLLNLVGELVTTRASIIDQGRRARATHGFKPQVDRLLETSEYLNRVSQEIQARVLKVRMVPARSVFSRFAGVVETMARDSGKRVNFELEGEQTEIDKRTIDALAEPLVHLVRNAIDHGIESVEHRQAAGKPATATLTLVAKHHGNRLLIEVRDDGAGVNSEAVVARAVEHNIIDEATAAQLDRLAIIELLFHPGFSTARRLTEISGRGVGLDAARRRVELLNGRLEITSEEGQGTLARIDLPLTTAIVRALMVETDGESYALPMDTVDEVTRATEEEITSVEGCPVLEQRGKALPVLYLREVVEGDQRTAANTTDVRHRPVVVVRSGEQSIGLVVDRVLQRQDIVIKAMGTRLAGIPGLAGASIRGDGGVVLVLDVGALVNEATASNEQRGTD